MAVRDNNTLLDQGVPLWLATLQSMGGIISDVDDSVDALEDEMIVATGQAWLFKRKKWM